MWFFNDYTSSAELKAKAKKNIAKLKDAAPVCAHSARGPICLTWWGKEWCKNLESYAEYENRLPRGRRYVRAGGIIDLKIKDNVAKAKIQSSGSGYYNVSVVFKKLRKEDMAKIVARSAQRIDNVDSLLKGDFPEDLKDLFTQEKPGLFPAPDEISFDCDCPDWTSMCKHVAAALYGVGIRIDESPKDFFALRGIDIENFLSGVVEDKVALMLKNVNVKSDRIITDGDMAEIFGIDGFAAE